jgi:hypothetical protein
MVSTEYPPSNDQQDPMANSPIAGEKGQPGNPEEVSKRLIDRTVNR